MTALVDDLVEVQEVVTTSPSQVTAVGILQVNVDSISVAQDSTVTEFGLEAVTIQGRVQNLQGQSNLVDLSGQVNLINLTGSGNRIDLTGEV